MTIRSLRSIRLHVGELVGTFVLAACGSAVLSRGHIGFAGVSAAFDLALLAMVYTVGPISGRHLNPAVTLGLVLSRKSLQRASGYVAAQIGGGILAAGLLFLIARGSGHFDPVATGLTSMIVRPTTST